MTDFTRTACKSHVSVMVWFFFFFFFETASFCNTGWLGIHYVVGAEFEFRATGLLKSRGLSVY